MGLDAADMGRVAAGEEENAGGVGHVYAWVGGSDCCVGPETLRGDEFRGPGTGQNPRKLWPNDSGNFR